MTNTEYRSIQKSYNKRSWKINKKRGTKYRAEIIYERVERR